MKKEDRLHRPTVEEMRAAARQEQIRQWLIAAGSGLTMVAVLVAIAWLLITAISSHPAVSPTPSPTLFPTHVAINTPVVTITRAFTPTAPPPVQPSPSVANCTADDLYRLDITGPVLSPAPGSVVTSADERLQAVWRVKNSGQCLWNDVRLFLVSTGVKPPPLPPIEPAGQVKVGAIVTVTLSVPAADLFDRKQINWVWGVQIKKAGGQVWSDLPTQLQLILNQPWAIPAQSLVTPVLPAPAQTAPAPAFTSVELISPAEGETFVGAGANITFRWTALARPLAGNEYYVLIINHRDGSWVYWTQTTEYTTPHEPDNNLGWLTEYGPELTWRVVVVQAENSHGLPDLTQLESDGNPLRHFRWLNQTFSKESWSNPNPTNEPDFAHP